MRTRIYPNLGVVFYGPLSFLGRSSFRVGVYFDLCVNGELCEDVEFCVEVKTMLKRHYFLMRRIIFHKYSLLILKGYTRGKRIFLQNCLMC